VNNHIAQLTLKVQEEMEERWRLEHEAAELLGLVVSEWTSDPMSVQCFDLRTVERSKQVMARLKALPPLLYGWVCPKCGAENAPSSIRCACTPMPPIQITC
jgi:hypothetical protein